MNTARLILVRGLPGSGKSTLARMLTGTPGTVHLEADHFFVNDQNQYVFDAARLPQAHAWCQNLTNEMLSIGHIVVVSNTFTTIKELRPYFVIAAAHGIVPQVIACQNRFNNIHNVPAESLQRMSARWVNDIDELFDEFCGVKEALNE